MPQMLSRRSVLRLTAFGALALSALALPLPSLAVDAVPLGGKLSGHLDGNRGGSFAFYTFYYPGDRSTVTINVQVTPDDPTVLQYAGIKVYGPERGREYVSTNGQHGQSPNVVGLLNGFDAPPPGTYLVQVFNYNVTAGIDYQIWADGLAAQPSTPTPSVAAVAPQLAAPPPPPSDNSTPAGALVFQESQSLSLPGGGGGHFAYYQFAYPGGWPVHIELKPDSRDKIVLKGVGFKVYGPVPDKEYVSSTYDDQQNFIGTADLWTNDQGTFLIQVYNYNPNPDTVVGYTLLGTGIPPQAGAPAAPAPAPGATGHTAIPLVGTQRGILPGGPAGRFLYYQFQAPAGITVSVDMEVTPDDLLTLSRAGYRVYGPEPNKEYLLGQSTQGKTPNVTGDLFVPENGVYVIQLYNYDPNPDGHVDFTLSARGLPGS